MSTPIQCTQEGVRDLQKQLTFHRGPKMTPEREQDILAHLLEHRNKNLTMRVKRCGLATIKRILKENGVRI